MLPILALSDVTFIVAVTLVASMLSALKLLVTFTYSCKFIVPVPFARISKSAFELVVVI